MKPTQKAEKRALVVLSRKIADAELQIKRFAGSEGTRSKPKSRACNLCDLTFQAKSSYERFCPECKESDELYRHAEWMSAG